MIQCDKKFLFCVIYFIVLSFTIYFSFTFISSYIKQKQEYELFKQSWQYVADTNFATEVEVNEEINEERVVNLISSPEQLAGAFLQSSSVQAESVTNMTELKYSNSVYRLTCNVDLDGRKWTSNEFGGTFDGGSFVISNLSICKDQENLGFVSKLSGTIKNVFFDNIDIDNDNDTGKAYRTGAVAGYVSDGTIEKVSVLSGTILGNIWNNKNEDRCVGGIAGYMDSGKIDSCKNNTKLGYGRFIGGIVGKMKGGTTTNCVNYSDITSANQNNINPRYGGICGESYGEIKLCINRGKVEYTSKVTGDIKVGGIVGHNDTKGIEKCANYGDVTGGNNESTAKSYVGGIAGYSKTNISYCYNAGNLKSISKSSNNSESQHSVGKMTKVMSYAFNNIFSKQNSQSYINLDTIKTNIKKLKKLDQYKYFLGENDGFGMLMGQRSIILQNYEYNNDKGDIMKGYENIPMYNHNGCEYNGYIAGYILSNQAGFTAYVIPSYYFYSLKRSMLGYAGGIVGWGEQVCSNCCSSGIIVGGYDDIIFTREIVLMLITWKYNDNKELIITNVEMSNGKAKCIYSKTICTDGINPNIDIPVSNCYSTYNTSNIELCDIENVSRKEIGEIIGREVKYSVVSLVLDESQPIRKIDNKNIFVINSLTFSGNYLSQRTCISAAKGINLPDTISYKLTIDSNNNLNKTSNVDSRRVYLNGNTGKNSNNDIVLYSDKQSKNSTVSQELIFSDDLPYAYKKRTNEDIQTNLTIFNLDLSGVSHLINGYRYDKCCRNFSGSSLYSFVNNNSSCFGSKNDNIYIKELYW